MAHRKIPDKKALSKRKVACNAETVTGFPADKRHRIGLCQILHHVRIKLQDMMLDTIKLFCFIFSHHMCQNNDH